MISSGEEPDLISGKGISLVAFAFDPDVVYVISDIQLEFIALCLAVNVLIGDSQCRLTAMTDTVVPPMIVIVLLMAEFDNNVSFFTGRGIIADHFNIGDGIILIASVRIFAVLNMHSIGSVDLAVPAGQHGAVPLPVVLFFRLTDMEPGVRLADPVVVDLVRVPGINLCSDSDILVIIQRLQIRIGERHPNCLAFDIYRVVSLFEHFSPMITIPMACLDLQIQSVLPVITKTICMQLERRNFRIIAIQIQVVLFKPDVVI